MRTMTSTEHLLRGRAEQLAWCALLAGQVAAHAPRALARRSHCRCRPAARRPCPPAAARPAPCPAACPPRRPRRWSRPSAAVRPCSSDGRSVSNLVWSSKLGLCLVGRSGTGCGRPLLCGPAVRRGTASATFRAQVQNSRARSRVQWTLRGPGSSGPWNIAVRKLA